MAGTLVLSGTALGATVNSWWLILPAFVGLNMLQSAFTGFCLAEIIFKRLGMRSKCNP